MADNTTSAAAVGATQFTKESIVTSKMYKKYQDYLNGNLDNDKTYTKQEVDDLLKEGGFI